MNKKRDPLANILEGKSPKDINELRTMLEEGMDAAGANDDLPEGLKISFSRIVGPVIPDRRTIAPGKKA